MLKDDPNATAEEVCEALASLQREEQKWRNKPGGYWIASTEIQSATQAPKFRFTTCSIAQLQVLTDGRVTSHASSDLSDDATNSMGEAERGKLKPNF